MDKEIFSGIDKRLKPKERGHIAIERLFPICLINCPEIKTEWYMKAFKTPS